MRRERDDDDERDLVSNTTSVAVAPQSLIQHPSRYFVPYTGRYYVHFMQRNCKGTVGFNMRFLLHSNGLCVVGLDPSNILVESYRNVFRSLSREKQEMVARAHRATSTCAAAETIIPRVADVADYCCAFPRKAEAESNCGAVSSFSTSQPCVEKPPAAGVLHCDSGADFYALVQRGEAALLPTSISHTIKGTRGSSNRLDKTANMSGKHKRNAPYVQEEMTLCSFSVDTMVKCPQCKKWQVLQQADPLPTTAEEQKMQEQQAASAPQSSTQGSKAHKRGGKHNNNKQPEHETLAAAATPSAVQKEYKPLRYGPGSEFPAGCAVGPSVAGGKCFIPNHVVKVPVAVNSVLLDVNQAVADSFFQCALSEPIGRGFLAIVQPRSDVSFAAAVSNSGSSSKFERVDNVSPFVSPSAEARLFVPDAFVGADIGE